MDIDLSGQMAQTGVFIRVQPDDPQQRLWLDCDLASLAEHRLGDTCDPRALDEDRRDDWLNRAVSERGDVRKTTAGYYEHCYWIVDGSERVGTIAIATSTLGSRRLHVSSFYVLPDQRGRGVGRRALAGLKQVLAPLGLGLRLDTSWTWQRTVRFYMNDGMWLYMWKRDLSFTWDPRTPPPTIVVGDTDAHLCVSLAGGTVTLASARRIGNSLQFHERGDETLAKENRIGEAYWQASSTLALAIALRGWPLIRSQEEYDRCYYAATAVRPRPLRTDRALGSVGPQARLERQTRRIPGLEYPTWSELEERWRRESAELDQS